MMDRENKEEIKSKRKKSKTIGEIQREMPRASQLGSHQPVWYKIGHTKWNKGKKYPSKNMNEENR